MSKRLNSAFYSRDVLEVAPNLLGKILVRNLENGQIIKSKITEVEAYRGEEDLACHASKGKTERNKIMYENGGIVYVYLIYGMYWMLNVVTGKLNKPEAALIRGTELFSGPGRITKNLAIGKDFYGENLETSNRLWIEDNSDVTNYISTKRIGVDYSGEIWKNKLWRFVINKI